MSEKSETLTIELSGRIDSGNASQVEEQLLAQLEGKEAGSLVLDASGLEYISSAGLRVILRLKKKCPELSIINVNSDVYEVLEMTGFTEMMNVKKAYHKVSIEGCEQIGSGANGKIYRIDRDNVVKVYNNPDSLGDIQHEREVAKLALVLGIPTAISYDIVQVGNCYGSVFELLNARSFAKILAQEPEKLDWCVKEYVDLLKKIHATEVPEGKLPSIKETAINWANFVKDYLPVPEGSKLIRLVNDVPESNHMIHGDYHTRNVELQNDEVLLIDMDTLAVGHPIFELGSMFNAFCGFYEQHPEQMKDFQGFDYELGQQFWHKTLAAYLGTENEEIIKKVEDKARIIGYTRLIRRSIRRDGLADPEKKAEIDHWVGELVKLIDTTDSLNFCCNKLEVEAEKDKLPEVIAFIEEHLAQTDCLPKEEMQITMAAEEIFINISSYAYLPDTGKATVKVEISNDPVIVTMTFMDNGVPYDPLAKEDPDIAASADDRPIGGLGIFLVKKTMDDVKYEYKDGTNILTLKKNLNRKEA